MNKPDHDAIQHQIEHTWPKWKIDWCNRHIITSKNAKKLVYRGAMS